MLSAVFDIGPAPPAPRPSGNADAGREDTAFSALVPEIEAAAATTPAREGNAPGADVAIMATDMPAAAVPEIEPAVADALAALLAATTAGGVRSKADADTADAPVDTVADIASDAETTPPPDARAVATVEMPVAVAMPAAMPVADAPVVEGETGIAIAAGAKPAGVAATSQTLTHADAIPEDTSQPNSAGTPSRPASEKPEALTVKSEPRPDVKPAVVLDPASLQSSAPARPDDALAETKLTADEDFSATSPADAKSEASSEAKPAAEPAARHDAKPADRAPSAQAAPIATHATQSALPHGDAAGIVALTPAAMHAAPHMPAQASQDTAQVASQPAATPIAAVPMEIAAQAREGKTRFEIRLDPPELGRIDVRLDIDGNGNVTSRLTVERIETLDLLRRDAPQLDRALQDAGLKTGDSALQFSLRQQDHSPREEQQQNRAQYVLTDDTVQLPETAARLYGRSGGTGGIDIRV